MYADPLSNSSPAEAPPSYQSPVSRASCDWGRIFLVAAGAILGLVGLFAVLHDQGIVACGLGSIGTGGGIGMSLAGFLGSIFAIFLWNREENKKSFLKPEKAYSLFDELSKLETKEYETVKFEFTSHAGEKEEFHLRRNDVQGEFHQKILRLSVRDLKNYSVTLLDKSGRIVNYESRSS